MSLSHPSHCIKIQSGGNNDAIVIAIPGETYTLDLIRWIRSWNKVDQAAVSRRDILGETDYIGLAWDKEEVHKDHFISTIVEMVCRYFGWDRTGIQFNTAWMEREEDISFAKEALKTEVPPFGIQSLALHPGSFYLLPGVKEVSCSRGEDGTLCLKVT